MQAVDVNKGKRVEYTDFHFVYSCWGFFSRTPTVYFGNYPAVTVQQLTSESFTFQTTFADFFRDGKPPLFPSIYVLW